MYSMSTLSFLFLVMVGVATASPAVGGRNLGGRTGGVGAVNKAVDQETQTLLEGVKGEVEAELVSLGRLNAGAQVSDFTVLSYSTQVVAGRNYFAKVRIAPNEYVHIRVYNHWSGTVELHSMQVDKSLADPVVHF
ncbi:unnamed protein product [Meganyctiphanes norvegica]|uniref:Cystatin domain-containing protein n=1 Tax=Meganyctiphanes norvegica TaxID=48144 RepID=A0AAV2QQQ3_MEGNR